MRPYVEEKKCVTCGLCEDVCPAEPNVFVMEEFAVVDHPEACFVCKACEVACPTFAIVIK